MNFACDSLKPKAKLRNEDFYFHIETPRGHFFAVLDFASHDYANLNATLKGKLETIVASFASLEDFSDALFLGFLAKEINNFVSNLADQSGGPELFFDAALCLVSNDNFAYFLAGEVKIDILNSEGLTPLKPGTTPGQLGERAVDVPLKDGIDSVTLQDDDLVLITTQGLEVLLPEAVTRLVALDPKSICDSLMDAGGVVDEDRTAVVIGGPYVRRGDTDSFAFAEFKASLASLTARVEALAEAQSLKFVPDPLEGGDSARLEEKLSLEIETLKDDLGGKAASIDLLELDEKVRVLGASIAGKADTADVLGLQRDVLKLGLTAAPASPTEAEVSADKPAASEAPVVEPVVETFVPEGLVPDSFPPSQKAFTLKAAIMIAVLSLVGGFAGGWLHARAMKRAPESWSVKTSGNHIVIGRLDGPTREAVNINLSEPVSATGEQTFSSFADVKRYVETITTASTGQTSQPTPPASASDNKVSENVSEITIKPGDSLKRLAQTYNVSEQKLMEMNPTVTKWPSIRIGQKIVVPAAAPTAVTTPPPQSNPPPATPVSSNTTEVTVGPGDSLNELARRFNTTAAKLKELNPQMNWPRIQTGQKVIVPATTVGG